MKILFISCSLRAGGKERQLIELIKGLKRLNRDIIIQLIIFDDNIHYKEIHKVDIEIHILLRNIKKDFSMFFKINKIVKDFKPDIVHSWDWMSSFYIIPIAKLRRIKIINGSIRYAAPVKIFSQTWLLAKILTPFSDVVVSLSKAGLKTHKFKQNRKHRVIYNGYDFSRNNINITDIRDELGFSNTSLLVGMIASFTDAKDYITYIAVAEKVSNKLRKIHFLCIGDGINRKNIESLVREKKIPNVHFLGIRSDVENICQNLDIGVLLSNTNEHAEGLSNATMEYMAAGLPVIATNSGGIPELIENGKDGFLVESFNVEQIANKITSLMIDKYIREKIGNKALIKIKEQFGIEKMINNYFELYNEVL